MPSDAENVSHLTLSALQAVKSPKDLRTVANSGGREQYDCSGNRQSVRDRNSEMGVNALERVETRRLILRRPRPDDADAIFARYASDAEVTRLLGWPRHESADATRAFLEFSDTEWARWPAGPYLVESRADGELLGGTGLGSRRPTAPRRGMCSRRTPVDLVRLYALCHVENPASWRVLEKCGFAREGVLQRHSELPNLKADDPCDVLCYALVLKWG